MYRKSGHVAVSGGHHVLSSAVVFSSITLLRVSDHQVPSLRHSDSLGRGRIQNTSILEPGGGGFRISSRSKTLHHSHVSLSHLGRHWHHPEVFLKNWKQKIHILENVSLCVQGLRCEHQNQVLAKWFCCCYAVFKECKELKENIVCSRWNWNSFTCNLQSCIPGPCSSLLILSLAPVHSSVLTIILIKYFLHFLMKYFCYKPQEIFHTSNSSRLQVCQQPCYTLQPQTHFSTSLEVVLRWFKMQNSPNKKLNLFKKFETQAVDWGEKNITDLFFLILSHIEEEQGSCRKNNSVRLGTWGCSGHNLPILVPSVSET